MRRELWLTRGSSNGSSHGNHQDRSLGILLAAKRVDLIDQILPYVTKILLSDIDLSTDLVAMVMDIAGEKWPL